MTCWCNKHKIHVNNISFIILLLLMFITTVAPTNNYDYFYKLNKLWNNSYDVSSLSSIMDNKCTRYLKAQEDLDLDRMMGKWHIIEVLGHKKTSDNDIIRQSSSSIYENFRVIHLHDICPIVSIRFDEKGLLRLLWTEDYGNLEYTFRILDVNDRSHGFWITVAPQNGSIIDNNESNRPYTQFNGTVIVTKAVADHVLLTFCSMNTFIGPNDYTNNNNKNNNNKNTYNQDQYIHEQQYYSLLMARQLNMLDKSSIVGIHNLLQRRGIGISTIKATCGNNASTFKVSYLQFYSLIVILSFYTIFYKNKLF